MKRDPTTALESSLAALRKSNAELEQATAKLTEANDRLARFLGLPVPGERRGVR